MTIVSAIFVARVVRPRGSTLVISTTKEQVDVRKPLIGVLQGKSIVGLTLLSLFLIGYVAMALVWEDFLYFDNVYFTLTTLRHHNIWLHIYPESGRFFPLAHQEFNLIRHFASTFAGYQVFRIAQLLIICVVLLSLDDELTLPARAGLAVFALISPAILVSFGGLIYTEWNVIFWLLLLLSCVKRFEQTQGTAWAVTAVICAQFMLYYKETAFLILGGFSVGRLVLRCRDNNEGRWIFARLKDKLSRLDWYLASLTFLFLIFFLVDMFPHFGTQYRDSYALPWSVVFRLYIKSDLLAWLFAGFVLWRTFRILCGKVRPIPYWDGLALGGVACMASYVCLKMYSSYYLAAVDLVAVLYLGRFAILNWEKTKLAGRLSLLFGLCAVLLLNVLASAYCLYERKNLIHGRALIAHVIQERYLHCPEVQQRLFFPFSMSGSLVSFASYLTYLGVPVEGSSDEKPIGRGGVVMVVKRVQNDGRCVDYLGYVCQKGTEPKENDLLIELPDDYVMSSEWTRCEKHEEVVFSYTPFPHIPSWLYVYFRRFHGTSRILPSNRLPDRWLYGSVVSCK